MKLTPHKTRENERNEFYGNEFYRNILLILRSGLICYLFGEMDSDHFQIALLSF